MSKTDELQAAAWQLLQSRTFGVLSTNSARHAGTPAASVVTYALDAEHHPLFLLSALALHTQNLLQNPKASLLVFEPDVEESPLTSARLNLYGVMREVPPTALDQARRIYTQTHPDAQQWIEFGDFSLYRMEVLEAYFVGGFGVMGWIPKL